MIDQLSDSRVPDCIEDLPGRDDLWSFLPHLALTLESERWATRSDSLSLTLVPEVEDRPLRSGHRRPLAILDPTIEEVLREEEDPLFLALELRLEELVQLLDRTLVYVGETLATRPLIEDVIVEITAFIYVARLELDRELDMEIYQQQHVCSLDSSDISSVFVEANRFACGGQLVVVLVLGPVNRFRHTSHAQLRQNLAVGCVVREERMADPDDGDLSGLGLLLCVCSEVHELLDDVLLAKIGENLDVPEPEDLLEQLRGCIAKLSCVGVWQRMASVVHLGIDEDVGDRLGHFVFGVLQVRWLQTLASDDQEIRPRIAEVVEDLWYPQSQSGSIKPSLECVHYVLDYRDALFST